MHLGATSTENDKIKTLFESDTQVIRISQSLTGNLLSASLINKNQQ